MLPNQTLLLNYLKKLYPNYTTATTLADYFNVTPRTIRNWVRSINETGIQVQSSKLGYRLVEATYSQVSGYNSENAKDRRAKIFVELLKGGLEGIDLFDLADNLFISESTLKTDIYRLKQEFPEGLLSIEIQYDCVRLIGTEQDKRKFMVSLLSSESTLNAQLKSRLEDMIAPISLMEIEEVVRAVLIDDYDIMVNQYVVRNIGIHLIVILERVQQGNLLQQGQADFKVTLVDEWQLAKAIIQKLEHRYHISIPEAEVNHLAMLFIGLPFNGTSKQSHAMISDMLNETMSEIIRQTEELYLIDLDDEGFKQQLLIHVYNLLIRSRYNSFERNSDLLNIKSNYPIVYDVSVYITRLIQQAFKITILEDEISYIALHIGALLEEQSLAINKKIRLLVVADDYRDIRKILTQRLTEVFNQDVQVRSTADYRELQKNAYDLLVTPDKQRVVDNPGAVLVNPFLLAKDLGKIELRIQMIRRTRQKVRLAENLQQYFKEELFMNQTDFSEHSVENIMDIMGSKLVQTNRVYPEFLNQIREREWMSSTDFPSGIAVPHTVHLSAKQTSIMIATLQTPVRWNQFDVHMVALIAINKNDAREFNEFLQQFIDMSLEHINVLRLARSDSYDEFIRRLQLLMDEQL